VVVVVVVDRKVSGEFGGDGGLKEGKNTGSATKKIIVRRRLVGSLNFCVCV